MQQIMHRVREPDQVFRTAEERRGQDMEECKKVFTAIGLELNDDISFCRRIGEVGDEPRPLVLILRTEEIKRKVLDRAKYLRDSTFQEVGIVPDLTAKQRREEQSMAEEVERKKRVTTTVTGERKRKQAKAKVVPKKGDTRKQTKGTSNCASQRGKRPSRSRRRQRK